MADGTSPSGSDPRASSNEQLRRHRRFRLAALVSLALSILFGMVEIVYLGLASLPGGVFHSADPIGISLGLSFLGSIMSVAGSLVLLLTREKLGRYLLLPGLILQVIFAIHITVTFTFGSAIGAFFAVPFFILIGIVVKAWKYL